MWMIFFFFYFPFFFFVIEYPGLLCSYHSNKHKCNAGEQDSGFIILLLPVGVEMNEKKCSYINLLLESLSFFGRVSPRRERHSSYLSSFLLEVLYNLEGQDTLAQNKVMFSLVPCQNLAWIMPAEWTEDSRFSCILFIFLQRHTLISVWIMSWKATKNVKEILILPKR